MKSRFAHIFLISLIALSIIFSACVIAAADDAKPSYTYYEDKGSLIIDGTGVVTEDDVLDAVGTKPINNVLICSGITEVGWRAFYGHDELTLVTFGLDPANNSMLRKIADAAFDRTSISEIYIPNGVEEIGDSAFLSCKNLASVKFDKKGNGNTSIKTIGDFAFESTALQSFTVPKTVTSLGINALKSCKNLKSIIFETNNSGECGITEIPTELCIYCDIQSVDIPKNITKISNGAFKYNKNLTSLNVPSGSKLTTIESYAFFGTALTSVELPSGVLIEQFAFPDGTTLGSFMSSGNIAIIAITGCSAVAVVVIILILKKRKKA